jgi:hypothetical protein
VTPAHAVFGGSLELLGSQLEPLPEVSYVARRADPVLWFRATRPVDRAYRFTLFVVGAGGLPRLDDDGNAAQLWYPTYRWGPGEVVRLRYPPITYTPGDRLGVGVQLGADPDGARLEIEGSDPPALDGGRVALLGRLP